jgi:hypothetical protein
MNQIYDAHPPNVKYEDKLPVYLHPTDESRYIPLTSENVQKWAAALVSRFHFISPACLGIADLKFLDETKHSIFNQLAATQTQI